MHFTRATTPAWVSGYRLPSWCSNIIGPCWKSIRNRCSEQHSASASRWLRVMRTRQPLEPPNMNGSSRSALLSDDVGSRGFDLFHQFIDVGFGNRIVFQGDAQGRGE